MTDQSGIFVTGAGGFIGRAIIDQAVLENRRIFAGLRQFKPVPAGETAFEIGDLGTIGDLFGGGFQDVAGQCDVVIHAAGLAHRYGPDPAALNRVNVEAARRLALLSVRHGVRRFILISSASVYGKSRADILSERSEVAPDDDYAASKWAAEQAVCAALAGTATQLCVIRPAAVIGPGGAGNIPRLIGLIRRGVPLPFAAIDNRRAFVALSDVAALIMRAATCAAPPACVMAAHPVPISTPDLIRALASGLGRNPRLFRCPPILLSGAARLLGRSGLWRSLSGQFVVDPDCATTLLHFEFKTSVPDALALTARGFS